MRILFILVVVFFLLMVASSPAATYPNQQPAPTVVQKLINLANSYWDTRQAKYCDYITAWTASSLMDEDGVDAEGRATTVKADQAPSCELWILDSEAKKAANSPYWEDQVLAAALVFHEVGHARGVPHIAGDPLMRPLTPEYPWADWVPPTAMHWGRKHTRSVLRNLGYSRKRINNKLNSVSKPFYYLYE